MFKAHSPHLLLSAAAAILLTTTSIVELPRRILFRFKAFCQPERSGKLSPAKNSASPADATPDLLQWRAGPIKFRAYVTKMR